MMLDLAWTDLEGWRLTLLMTCQRGDYSYLLRNVRGFALYPKASRPGSRQALPEVMLA